MPTQNAADVLRAIGVQEGTAAPPPTGKQNAADVLRAIGVREQASPDTPLGAPTWDWVKNTINGLTLGGYAAVKAFEQAHSAQVNAGALGGGGQDVPHQTYGQAKEDVAAARAKFQAEHPFASFEELALGTVPAMAASALLPEIAIPSAAARLLPVNALGAAVSKPLAWLGNKMLQGGAVGGAMNQLTGNPLAQDIAVGGVANTALGATGKAVGWGVRSAIDAALAAAAKRANALGVNIRPGQVAEKGTLLSWADRTFAGGKADKQQLVDYTKAAAKTIGEDVDRITPEILEAAETRVGETLDNFQANTALPAQSAAATQLKSDLQLIAMDTENLHPKEIESIGSMLEYLAKRADAGLSGKAFREITRYNAPLSEMQRAGGNVGQRAVEMRNALEEAFVNANPPERMAQLYAALDQWRNIATLRPIVQDAGPAGIISPQALFDATKTGRNSADITALGQVGKNMPKVSAEGGAAGGGSKVPLGAAALAGAGEVAGDTLLNLAAGHDVGLNVLLNPHALSAAGGAYLTAKGAGVAMTTLMRSRPLARAAGMAPQSNGPSMLTAPVVAGTNTLLAPRR